MDIKPITKEILVDRIKKVLDKIQPDKTLTKSQYFILCFSFMRLRTYTYQINKDYSKMSGDELFWDILGVRQPKYTKEQMLKLAKLQRESTPIMDDFLLNDINIFNKYLKSSTINIQK